MVSLNVKLTCVVVIVTITSVMSVMVEFVQSAQYVKGAILNMLLLPQKIHKI